MDFRTPGRMSYEGDRAAPGFTDDGPPRITENVCAVEKDKVANLGPR